LFPDGAGAPLPRVHTRLTRQRWSPSLLRLRFRLVPSQLDNRRLWRYRSLPSYGQYTVKLGRFPGGAANYDVDLVYRGRTVYARVAVGSGRHGLAALRNRLGQTGGYSRFFTLPCLRGRSLSAIALVRGLGSHHARNPKSEIRMESR